MLQRKFDKLSGQQPRAADPPGTFTSFADLAADRGIVVEPPRESKRGIDFRPGGCYNRHTLPFFSAALRRLTDEGSITAEAHTSLRPAVAAAAHTLGSEAYAVSRTARRLLEGYRESAVELLQRVKLELVPETMGRVEIGIPAAAAPGAPSLPPAYGFKGGMARRSFLQVLGLGTSLPRERDVDLIRRGGGPMTAEDISLSREHMADDFSRNQRHGVEFLPNLAAFLSTREITLNEVIWLNGRVICTPQCIFDTLAGVIRPTTAELRHGKNGISGKVATKMLRFAAQSAALGQEVQLESFFISTHQPVCCFDAALNLKRSLQHGKPAGELFIALCRDFALLPDIPFAGGVEDAARSLAGKIRKGARFFEL